MNSGCGLPHLLLVEPDFLLRRTVASVVRELGLAQVQEATSLDRATLELARVPFDAILISLDPEGEALKLLDGLRGASSRSKSATPVAVTADGCDAGLALRLRELEVRRLLLKPFKVRSVVETIAGLCAETRALE